MGSFTPVFQIFQSGEVVPFGKIISLYPASFAFVMELEDSKPQCYPGLPFFIDDMRPQGFLGRAFGQKHSDLKLPVRIQDWSNDDILEAISRSAEDQSGNFLIGAESFERHQSMRQSKLEAVPVDHPESMGEKASYR